MATERATEYQKAFFWISFSLRNARVVLRVLSVIKKIIYCILYFIFYILYFFFMRIFVRETTPKSDSCDWSISPTADVTLSLLLCSITNYCYLLV